MKPSEEETFPVKKHQRYWNFTFLYVQRCGVTSLWHHCLHSHHILSSNSCFCLHKHSWNLITMSQCCGDQWCDVISDVIGDVICDVITRTWGPELKTDERSGDDRAGRGFKGPWTFVQIHSLLLFDLLRWLHAMTWASGPPHLLGDSVIHPCFVYARLSV